MSTQEREKKIIPKKYVWTPPNFISKTDILEYNTNSEYREIFRQIVSMEKKIEEYPSIKENGAILDDFSQFDSETQDEMFYDSDAVSKFLKYIYQLTGEHFDFQDLYELAAAKMISTDYEIGLSVLCSYDYLKYFYPCLCSYIENPEKFNDCNKYYLKLKNAL
jgi:hypothetical protein